MQVTITVTDNNELANNNTYEYYLSTSKEDTIGGNWTTYRSGKAFTIGTNLTGNYYLHVKPVYDKAGNTSGNVVSEAYYFDNEKPTANVNILQVSDEIYTLMINISDNKELDLSKCYYALSKSSIELGTNIQNYDNVFEDSSKALMVGICGTYYLHILVTDKLGNTDEYISEKLEGTNTTYGQVITSKEFPHTGSYEEYIVPNNGLYKIELWGASGKTTSYTAAPGLGGYTKGNIILEQGTKLYFYVGESGNLTSSNYGKLSFNGGGYTHSSNTSYGRGGGATDVRLEPTSSQNIWNEFDSLKSRIMVAGGGGSGHNAVANTGGAAGGLSSYKGNGTATTGAIATQTSGYAFGYGGPGLSSQAYSASGGGYYGGKSSTSQPCDISAGGSSYISGHLGCDAITSTSTSSNIVHTGQSVHYSGYKFLNTSMIDGKGYEWTDTVQSYVGMPTHDNTSAMTGNTGDGYAKIEQYEGYQYMDTPVYANILKENGRYNIQVVLNSPNTVDLSKSKYTISQSSTSLGTDLNNYDKTFRSICQNIQVGICGNYYLHIAMTDTQGNVTIYVSEEMKGENIEYGEITDTKEFTYTGKYEEYPVTNRGLYEIELWGASGKTTSYTAAPGLGGYTKGDIFLEQGTKLYFYVGESGNVTSSNYGTLSFNGGGYTHNYSAAYGRGGGATDVRLEPTSSQNIWNEFDSLKSRIMVAGGGGSGHSTSTSTGGAGGGLSSYKGNGTATTGAIATQTSGYAFGSGGPGLSGQAFSASGGGYYGGKSSTTSPCDISAGGSSYISGHFGCDAITSTSTSSSIVHTGQSVHYSGYQFFNTSMIDGKGYEWTNTVQSYVGMPTHDNTSTMTGNTGDGYAKITRYSGYRYIE